MTDIPALTPLQESEREALCGDRGSIVAVVSALRTYRMLLAEWRDECNESYNRCGAPSIVSATEDMCDE